MNRHSRQKFYAELDAYAAFWAEAHKSAEEQNGDDWFPECETQLESIVDRIKRFTD